MRIRLLTTVSVIACVTFIGSFTYSPVVSADAGDWLIRFRALYVDPNDNSGEVSGIPGSGVSVGSDLTPELDFTYFITDKLAVEAILGSSKHDIKAEGSIKPLGKIAEVRTLPPTVTLQYHFQPDAKVRPYVGLGLNYTKFFNEEATDSLQSALGPTNIDLSSSWGLAGQLGIDIAFQQDWFFNFDVKYIFMDTTATLTSGSVVRKLDVNIDPLFVGFGIGRHF